MKQTHRFKKIDSNMRMLFLNPYKINLQNKHNTKMLKSSCMIRDLEILLLNETQVKQILSNADKMQQQLSYLGREAIAHRAIARNGK